MINFKIKDNFSTGLGIGFFAITGIYFLLTAIDLIICRLYERPFFVRQDSKQLLILATVMILFRNQIKDGHIELAKGIYLAIFCSAILYLVHKKTNLALW